MCNSAILKVKVEVQEEAQEVAPLAPGLQKVPQSPNFFFKVHEPLTAF